MNERRVRVMIVDDSATVRLGLRRLLAQDDGIEVVGEAADGKATLAKFPGLMPDLVLMDVLMPEMDGLETTREILRRHPKPILLVSDLVEHDPSLPFRALEAGALEVIAKPTAADLQDPARARRFIRKIRMLAKVPVITRRHSGTPGAEIQACVPENPSALPLPTLVAIGASTGGPPALEKLLRGLGGDPPFTIAVVQHMTQGFLPGMVRWLIDVTGRRIVLGDRPRELEPGLVVVACDDNHLELSQGRLLPVADPPRRGHRPSVDHLFESIAATPTASRSVGMLLTGMGDDGARGLLKMRMAGAYTLVQDEASSVVYGMPKVAKDLGAGAEQLSLAELSDRLRGLAAKTR